jgi:hypothetical protein
VHAPEKDSNAMKCKLKPTTYAEARLAMAAAAVGVIMHHPTPAEERFVYLSAPVDQPTAKNPFDVGLYQITSIQNRKQAVARFREFMATLFSEQEVNLFIESRADRMPPVLRDWGWDYGGFLVNEIPIFTALFTKWSNAERVKNTRKKKKNLQQGVKNNLTPENYRDVA